MRPPLFAAIGLLSLASACAHDEHPDQVESYNCGAETRDDDFVVGLEKFGERGALAFKLMSADPAPPSRDDNTWVVQVSVMTSGVVGAPISGASLNVSPFMPDHQHGTPIEVKIEPMPQAGQYTLSPVNLWMPGLWDTTISATTNGTTDKVVYRFCIAS